MRIPLSVAALVFASLLATDARAQLVSGNNNGNAGSGVGSSNGNGNGNGNGSNNAVSTGVNAGKLTGYPDGTYTLEPMEVGLAGTAVTLTSLAIAAIAGIVLNAILPGKDYEFGSDVTDGRSADFGRY